MSKNRLSSQFWTGYWAGMTLYPVTKCSPRRAVYFREISRRRLLVNSSADWGPSDPFTLQESIVEFRRRGHSLQAAVEYTTITLPFSRTEPQVGYKADNHFRRIAEMGLKLYDTLTREVRDIFPMDKSSVRFYACGPTVYGPAHVGNFRTFVMQDVFGEFSKLPGSRLFMSEILRMWTTKQFVNLRRKELSLRISLRNGLPVSKMIAGYST